MKSKLLNKPNLATLTPDEDSFWERTFSQLLNEGVDESAADKQAWEELQEFSPRLKDFDGCLP